MKQKLTKIPIWGDEIPGNSKQSKLDVMEIDQKEKLWLMAFAKALGPVMFSKKYKDHKKRFDTLTYTLSIKRGIEKETFEDMPYLVPFTAKSGSPTKAVIVVPGGAYAYKQMDFPLESEEGNEHLAVAAEFQKAGISAFVLWYRSNPYYQPIPLLDLQRAVRYLKAHAEEYNIDPEHIGIMGFSAGGAQTSMFLNLQRGKPVEWAGYTPDAVDAESDEVAFAAHVYPALNYRYLPTMLFASFPGNQVRDPATRARLMDEYDSVRNFNSAGIPQIISYGTKDMLVDMRPCEEYVEKLKATNTPYDLIVLEGQNHGYGRGTDEKVTAWLYEAIDWIKAL